MPSSRKRRYISVRIRVIVPKPTFTWQRNQISNSRWDSPKFWKKIDAQGDLDAALKELSVRHNAKSERNMLRALGRAIYGRFQ